MAAVADELSHAFMPLGLSLLVAIPAVWFYRFLANESELLDVEMENAILELANQLGRRR